MDIGFSPLNEHRAAEADGNRTFPAQRPPDTKGPPPSPNKTRREAETTARFPHLGNDERHATVGVPFVI